MCFLLLTEAWVLNSIKAQFFQVANFQLPSNGAKAVVQIHAFIVEEARIIAADWKLEAMEHQITDWVLSQVQSVSQHKIWKWADFNANILFNILLHKIGE